MDNSRVTIILLFSFLLFHHSLAVVNTITSENGHKTLDQKQTTTNNNNDDMEKLKLKRYVHIQTSNGIKNDVIAEDRMSPNDLSSGLLTNYPSSFELPSTQPLNVPLSLMPPANSFVKNFRPPDVTPFANPKFPLARPFTRGYSPTPSFLQWKMGIALFNNNNHINSSPFQGPPPIPTSLELYGPPRKPPLPPFLLSGFPSKDFKRLSTSRIIPNNLHQDFSKLSITAPGIPGLSRIRTAFAPPTPPNIEYDGWQPIAGSIPQPPPPPPPNHYQSLQPALDTISDSQRSSQNNIDTAQIAGIPSNSYGEPLNNPADHNLKQQVIQGDSGLEPPLLPDTEPLHTISEQTDLNSPHLLPLPVEPVNNNDNHNSINNEFPPTVVGSDLDFQQLPNVNSEPLKSSFDNFNENVDSYLVPPPSSFSSTGPYPASQRRPDYSKRHQHAYHIPRNNGPIRPPHTSHPFSSLPGNLIPPRNWAAKFRDSTGEFSSITNMYSLPAHHSTQFIDSQPQEVPIDSDASMTFNELIGNDNILSAINDGHHHNLNNNNTAGLIKNIGLNEVDHYDDNSLIASSNTVINEIPKDDFQIQGSKGVYSLQIQPADGLKSADDTVVHSQLLSNGLLENIIAAIEQPGGGPIEIQSTPEAQSLQQQIYTNTHKDYIDLSAASSSIVSVTDKQSLRQVDTSKSIETDIHDIQRTVTATSSS